MLARQDDEQEDRGLDDGQKARLRAMAIGPIRAGAGRLEAGERSDYRSVVRHLRPVQGVLRGFAAPGETQEMITDASQELATVI